MFNECINRFISSCREQSYKRSTTPAFRSFPAANSSLAANNSCWLATTISSLVSQPAVRRSSWATVWQLLVHRNSSLVTAQQLSALRSSLVRQPALVRNSLRGIDQIRYIEIFVLRRDRCRPRIESYLICHSFKRAFLKKSVFPIYFFLLFARFLSALSSCSNKNPRDSCQLPPKYRGSCRQLGILTDSGPPWPASCQALRPWPTCRRQRPARRRQPAVAGISPATTRRQRTGLIAT